MYVSLRTKHLLATGGLGFFAFIGIVLLLFVSLEHIEAKERGDVARHLAWTNVLVRTQFENYAERTRLFAQSAELDVFANALGAEGDTTAYANAVRALLILAEHDANILEVVYVDAQGVEQVKVLREEVLAPPREALARERLQRSVMASETASLHPEEVGYTREGTSVDGSGVLTFTTQVPSGPSGDFLIVRVWEDGMVGTLLEEAVSSGAFLLASDQLYLINESFETITLNDSSVDVLRTNGEDGVLLFSTSVPLGNGIVGDTVVLAKLISRAELLADYTFARALAINIALYIIAVICVYNVGVYFLLRGVIVLYQTIQEYGKGNFDAKITRIANDEVGVVSTALNTLLEAARGAEKDRKNFIQYATHQMRTPAAVMAKTLDDVKRMLVKKRYPKKVINLVEDAEDQNRYTLRVSNTFLRYIELSRSYRIEEREDVDLYKLVKHIERLNDDLITENELNVRISVSRKLRVHCQRAGISRAIEQVVSNAIHYSNTGGTIAIRAEKEGEMIILSVEDHGIGIPAREEHEIFQGFYRATNAVLKFRSGSGLGLVIAKRIVKAHGGDIWFKSKEGKGTTFFISLPTS